jgi:integral membrane protein (TIGR00529 family)
VLDLFKLVGVLALVIILLRFNWNLGVDLLLASALTGLLFGRAADDLLLDALGAAVDPLTLRLVAIVLLIMFLGEILRGTLQMEGLVRSLGDLFVDRRWLLVLIPMLIGVLPMVGGAMFSAPMVEEASQGLNVNRERRTFLNYWFRHAMESVLPLYPSLILAAGLMGVSVQMLAINQLPLFLASVVGGFLFGLLGIRRSNPRVDDHPGRKDTWILLLKSIWPIALVLVLSMLLGVDLILALLLTLAALILVHRLGLRQLWDLVRRIPLDAVPIIVGALVFRRVLETSQAVEAASTELGGLGIPLTAIVFAVPLIAGLLTGLAAPAFAIGLPIVLPLCGPDVLANGCGILAYTGGLVGILVSPIHLCLALTRVYFGATWGGVYRHIVPAALLLAATAAGVMLLK